MMAILAIAIGDPSCGTLGKLGIQLLNLSLASFALQLIIVALAIWHCIATPELEPGQRHKLGTLSCCHGVVALSRGILTVYWGSHFLT